MTRGIRPLGRVRAVATRALPLAGLILLAPCAPESRERDGTSPSLDPEEIGEALDAWVEMWNSYDLARVDRLFMHGSQVSYFSSEREGLISGFDEVVAHHEGFGFVTGGEERPSRLWLEEVDITSHGGVAVVAAIWYFDRDGTGAQVQKGPVTFVYAPSRDGPRIVHANFSEYPSAE